MDLAAGALAVVGAAWSGVELVEPLAGGHRNPVFLASRGSCRLVVRRSGRPVASLDWELDLLAHLAGLGIAVPGVIPADDGRRHVNGWLVQPFITGGPPRDAGDWRRAVAVLAAVHDATRGWPQRPGFASSRQLLTADHGGDVALSALPADALQAIRAAWRPVTGGPECAIHGDLGAGNLLVDGDRVALLDWDEARVDVPWFDFAFVPDEVGIPFAGDRRALVTAGVAWEAATCWLAEPEYAARRLGELYGRVRPPQG